MNILFLSFTCEDVDVAMVTNMISQLQESFLLRRVTGSLEILFAKCGNFISVYEEKTPKIKFVLQRGNVRF